VSKYPLELLNKIKACTDQNMVEQAFEGKNMTAEEKAGILLEIMGDPIVFYHNGNPSPEQQYEALTGSFLSGIWKPEYSTFEAMRGKQ